MPTPERFESWFEAARRCTRSDARHEARPVAPEEFERVYDCVDDAFGTRRPRKLFDWLYRLNPLGPARCIAVFDADGNAVSSHAYFPWPLRRGGEGLDAVLGGDDVTRRALQGSGASRLRRGMDPQQAARTEFAWPNLQSRRLQTHLGRTVPGAGPLPRLGLVLRAAAGLRRLGLPPALTSGLATLGDAALGGLRALVLRRGGDEAVPVPRFDASFDAVVAGIDGWPGYWSDRDAAFLNWRYLAHPTRSYAAFAVPGRHGPRAFCVVSLSPPRATLAELRIGRGDAAAARALVRRAARAGLEAGCTLLEFFAPPGSVALSLLRRCGFVPLRSDVYVYLRAPPPPEEWADPIHWRLVPGDAEGV